MCIIKINADMQIYLILGIRSSKFSLNYIYLMIK